MKRIICDLDSIVIDLLVPWIAEYNRRWSENISVESITDYGLEKFVKPERVSDLFGVLGEPGFYLKLPPLAGAVEALTELHKNGYDIVVATAVASSGNAQDKFVWCKKHLPFLKHRDIFVGARKELLRGDVFIDDAPKNIVAYRNAWPDATIMTIAYPYNQDCKTLVDVFAHSHQDTKGAWREMTDAILAR